MQIRKSKYSSLYFISVASIFKISELFTELKKIKSNNAQGEYYLTDVIELIRKNKPVHASIIEDSSEVLGINTIAQLDNLENRNS